MKVFYEDDLPEVTVPGVSEPVKRGETVDVDPEVGKQLLKQGWKQKGSKADSAGHAAPQKKAGDE